MIDKLQDLFSQVTSLGPEALVAFATIIVCYLLRLIPGFNKDWTPIICILFPVFAYPPLCNVAEISAKGHYPDVRAALYGLIIGFISWEVHQLALKRIEDWISARMDAAGFPKGGS